MKAFWTYTLMRLALTVACYAVIAGVWMLVFGTLSIFWPILLALVISGVLSYRLLRPQRETFARAVEDRATRATRAFEERKAREDVD